MHRGHKRQVEKDGCLRHPKAIRVPANASSVISDKALSSIPRLRRVSVESGQHTIGALHGRIVTNSRLSNSLLLGNRPSQTKRTEASKQASGGTWRPRKPFISLKGRGDPRNHSFPTTSKPATARNVGMLWARVGFRTPKASQEKSNQKGRT